MMTKTNTFRPKYRELSGDEKDLLDTIKNAFELVENVVNRTKPSRYRSLAMTSLEESCMWAIKGLTSGDG